ncbi:MAG: peptidoglycan-binding protein [Clostridia bacterium]|nr:peptidoglycan-binding protein [Clostridia bacterium]
MHNRLICLFAVLALLGLSLAGSTNALAIDNDPYRIEVDLLNQITTVYHAQDGSVARQMICSSGANNATPEGTFHMEQTRPDTDRVEWYYITSYRCYVKYATRIRGPILFHSLPYAEKDMSTLDQEAASGMGKAVSHGCIRLYWQDAKWIADNCPVGTEVRIFYGEKPRDELKRLLAIGSFTEDCGLTYDQFISSDFAAHSEGELGRGDSGDAVTALQQRLGGLGFLTGSVSGIYDLPTLTSVMRYQAARGEAATGVATEAQIDAILNEDSPVADDTVLDIGMRGPLVVALQERLGDIGLYGGMADGVYSDALAQSVRTFCECTGAEPSQQAGPELRGAVEALHRTLTERFPEGGIEQATLSYESVTAVTINEAPLFQAASSFSRKLTTVHRNTPVQLIERKVGWSRVDYGGRAGYIANIHLNISRSEVSECFWGHRVDIAASAALNTHCFGEAVPTLQMRLRALGFYTGAIGLQYDETTAEAVCAYQEAVGLTPTGEASETLQEAIFESDAITGTRVTLCEGDESPAVAAIQRALIALGCYEGPSHGRFDGETADAIRLFLEARGLSDNGDVSSALQRLILDSADEEGAGKSH